MSDATTTREKYLADLERKAATGDVAAQRMLKRIALEEKFARDAQLHGTADHNGRLPFERGG